MVQRINIDLSPLDHRRAKALAIVKGVTLNEYLAEAISDAVANVRDVEIYQK